MEWWQIVLIVLAGIISVWILLILISVIFASVFGHKIKHGNVAVNLLLNQRYEVVKSLIGLLQQKGIEVSKDDVDAIDALERIHDYQRLKKDVRDCKVLNFVHASHNITLLAKQNEGLLNDTNYQELSVSYWEVEESYRQKSALYNADCIGYNYWISVPYSKFLFKLFKKTTKDLIV